MQPKVCTPKLPDQIHSEEGLTKETAMGGIQYQTRARNGRKGIDAKKKQSGLIKQLQREENCQKLPQNLAMIRKQSAEQGVNNAESPIETWYGLVPE
jgi:hypothetical protein